MDTATAERRTIHLDVVLYREDDYWVAHCVQLDILTSGLDRDQVWNDATKMVQAHLLFAISHDPGLKHLFRPPSEELMAKMAWAIRDKALTVQLNGTVADHPVSIETPSEVVIHWAQAA